MNLRVDSPRGTQTLVVNAREARLRLSELLRQKHLPLNTRCGQRGLCDGCLVEVFDGPTPRVVRGCEYRLGDADLQIRIPARSLLAYEPQVVSEFKINVPRAQDPLWQQVASPAAKRRPIRYAPDIDGTAQFTTLEYRDDHWLATGSSETALARPLGAAIDVGTTTVALLVVDLTTGKIIGSAANFNKQMHLGDDVLTRINLCLTDREQIQHLQDLAVKETILHLLTEALQEAGPDQLRCVTVAGNTTMLHLLDGVDPSSMGVAPFTPAFLDHRVVSSALAPGASVHLLPGAAAYVGADLTAGALATGLIYDDGPSLLVDVGTNGEIILKHGEHLFGCATAAGPAFEGAGLTSGVRATDGAISHIALTRDPFRVKTERIGHHAAIGLCGTAYIDFLAEGRRIGLLNAAGRFDTGLVSDGALAITPNVTITEYDIACLLQAKAAIAAGILTLLERRGLKPAQIKKLYLAGGFGLHLHRQNAIECGLLPGFEVEQIEVVGNTSLAGAYLALLDCGALDEMTRAARKMEVIELNLDPGFEDRYIDQLTLPGSSG